MTDSHIFQTRYAKLNEEQKRAVDTTDGPVLVIAGPGSGKTEILSLRVANILQKTDTLPGSILCLTFTDSAAANMRRRLSDLIGNEAYKVAIHTFHSFGSEIIGQNPEYFYNGAIYNPADKLVQIQILEEIMLSLRHDNPLTSYHPEQGYTYLNEILNRIADLKGGGLTPEEFEKKIKHDEKFLLQANPIITSVFEDRIDKKNFGKFQQAIDELKGIGSDHDLIGSFALALTEAQDDNSTKPLTAWKNQYTCKNDNKENILKDYQKIPKLLALADIYNQYQTKLHEKAYFDFSDMLLDTVNALENNPELRYNLQERYLYVLVDEFQDTNGVQMRLLDQLLDADVNEGRPNILAVGDDDQAIFKFQGANIQNILSFHQKYRDPSMIVLDKNYRSTQKILDFVRPIILQGEERLENRLEEISKELKSANDHENTSITEKNFIDKIQESIWIAEEIRKNKTPLNEIAVIGRKHRDLEDLAKVLDYFGIAVNYERRRNLLEQLHVRELVTILQFINDTTQDHYLPEILSFPFWNFDRLSVWDISMKAYKGKKMWLEVMLESLEFSPVAKFLIELEGLAKEKTSEEIIDLITGSNSLKDFTSPYRSYYFRNSEKDTLDFLESLKGFIDAVRKHKSRDILMVPDVLEFIDLHIKHHLPLNYTSQYGVQESSVNLVTAHSAKGLEFDTVFILHCQESCWVPRGIPNKLAFPSNLPLSAENDSVEDKLRLFYVALTRAKNHLYLTSYKESATGKEEARLRFLTSEAARETAESIKAPLDLLTTEFAILSHKPPTADENALLKKLVQNYKLSVTHLNNFLNIIDHGPQKFLENNLLRFPQMMSPSAAYGAAVHDALHALQTDLRQNHHVCDLEFFIKQFQQSLTSYRLNRQDFKKLLEKGTDQLSIYYEQRKSDFQEADLSEFDFNYQSVVIGEANVTGKVDKLRFNTEAKEITVYDYKTGRALMKWENYDEYKLRKAWGYKNQLMFYKLLVENSRNFHGYHVNKGVLEFVEPVEKNTRILELVIDPLEVEQLRKLIGVVYNKIVSLDFPDTSAYEKEFGGIQRFIIDLLEGRI